MSPETISSVFPERLIHPLPKRRLRERLSPDVADSIKFPPAHIPGTPLFYYPYNLKDEIAAAERTGALGRAGAAAAAAAAAAASPPAPMVASTAATAAGATATVHNTRATPRARADRDDDESVGFSRVVRLVSRSARSPQLLNPSPSESHQTVPSTASSVDGYDSFENTNNKKKRKVPTAGDTPHSGSYTSVDLRSATSGSSSTNNTHDDSLAGSPPSTTYSGPASFVSESPGISGPGRGRYGRSRNGRTPLHPLSDANSNWAGRHGKMRPSWLAQFDSDPVLAKPGKTGIISSAIADAAEKQASHDQEDTGFYHQQSSTASTPASAQFTFTCTSQVPGNLTWPGSDPKTHPSSAYWQHNRFRGAAPGQAASTMADADSGQAAGEPTATAGGLPGDADQGRPGHQPTRKKKPRSKISHELDKQARERRRLQQEQNALNPPTEDAYICPFCEYENIHGYKPRFLIRSFEMKERKKRLEAERRQRLLDKAKARARKGRKATKAGASATAATAKNGNGTAPDAPPHDTHSDDASHDAPGNNGYDYDDADGGQNGGRGEDGDEDGDGDGDGVGDGEEDCDDGAASAPGDEVGNSGGQGETKLPAPAVAPRDDPQPRTNLAVNGRLGTGEH
ncbi:hypothetical protein SPI_03977 [Niveomyces insectorum RCEF 264]|uniref:Uncharacterized protein n=1 Tax=Niveomyces insectorum RCEF 264 TaxID=1081102 RepID=A0A167VBM2_9HYPO|nr:hypothetical protein SPI_03977 [Niveomyces insectorum RCEF 264]